MRLVIKLGGSLIEDSASRRQILAQIAALGNGGHQILLVHGGGKLVSRYLARLGIESRFVQGLRVTDQETLNIAIMVLAGLLNKRLVSEANRAGARAIGISGGDAQAVLAEKLTLSSADIDLGFVGKVVSVNAGFFSSLFAAGLLPVVASIASTSDFEYLNVNADQMASACASALKADKLIFLTDVPGVLDRSGALITELSLAAVKGLIDERIISGGMLPKINSCCEALEQGVRQVCILGGKDANLLDLNFDGGTTIHA